MFQIDMTVDQSALEQVYAVLDAFPKKIRRKMERKALRDSAKEVADMVRKLAPKRTGALASSVKVRALPEELKKNRSDIGMSVKVEKSLLMSKTNKNYPYFVAVEYGAKHMSPHPFMRASAKVMRPKITELYKKNLQLAIADMTAKVLER